MSLSKLIKLLSRSLIFVAPVLSPVSCSSPGYESEKSSHIRTADNHLPQSQIINDEISKQNSDQLANILNSKQNSPESLEIRNSPPPQQSQLNKNMQVLKLTGHTSQRLKKISNSYYENSLKEIFDIDISLYLDLARDTKLHGFESIARAHNKITPLAIEKYFDLSEKVSHLIIKLNAYKKYTSCQCDDTYQQRCLTDFISQVMPLLIKSDVKSTDVQNLVNHVEKMTGPGEQNFCAYLKPGLKILLFSPGFIYFENEISESAGSDSSVGTAENQMIKPYSGHSLAHKLSSFIWDAPPGLKVLNTFKDLSLVNEEKYQGIINEMLQDDRVKNGIMKFFIEYLSLDQLYNPGIQTKESAEESKELRSLYTEIEFFLNYHFSDRNSSVEDLLTSRTSFINRDLNEIYQTNMMKLEFTKTEFDESHQRHGIFGKAGMMRLLSHGEETSPTLRGKTISDLFLCRTLPQPDGEADTSFPERKEGQTKRDLIKEHLENPSCASCHSLMDPLGLPFEIFDSKGLFRSVDEFNIPIDSSGEFKGKEYQTPGELLNILADSQDFTFCFAKKMVEFATGDDAEDLKKAGILDSVHQVWASKNFRIKELMKLIVTSSFFRNGKKI